MKPRTLAITTLGCKVNQYDSATIEEAFREKGYEIVDFCSRADIYIVNTCTVTHKTDYQSRQLIRRAHRKNPQAEIIVTGCYAQVAPQTIANLPGVSLILGNSEKHSIAELVATHQGNASPSLLVSDITQERVFKDPPLHSFSDHTRAFLKIQDGCEAFCSYCIVPYARGKCRSLDFHEVLTRLHTLGQTGFKEVVLSGIHLGAYGVDLTPSRTLLELLRIIEKEKPTPRIRLSSLEPMDISSDLIEFLSRCETICPHLHLPLQSGDDDILRQMNRPYRRRDFIKVVEKIVATIDHLCVGVDVIVGFPGESDHHFLNTYQLLEELPVAYLHVFPYSKRENTPAATLPGQVPPTVIRTRSEMTRSLDRIKRKQFYSQYAGKELDVLIEGTRDRCSHLLKGRTRNYIPVLLQGPDSLKNQEVAVKILKITHEKVWGIKKEKAHSKW